MLNPKVHALRADVVAKFSAAWELNDEAHRCNHFVNVEACALEIDQRLGLNQNPQLILMAAYFHDMFAWSRVNHHLLSAEWVKSTDYEHIVALSNEDRALLSHACREHRASFKGQFTSLFSELMNAADRELPGQIEDMLERAIQYRAARGMTRDEALAPAIAHIKEKFGTGGYARYPRLYLDAFGDALEVQRKEIDNL